MTGVPPLFTEDTMFEAQLIVYTPIVVTELISRAYILMGFGVGAMGNDAWDLGLYRSDSEGKPGAKIGSTGSFTWNASPALSAYRATNPALPPLPPGTYWLASNSNGDTDTIVQLGVADDTSFGIVLANGIYAQQSTFPLPATATPSSVAVNTPIPLMALVAY